MTTQPKTEQLADELENTPFQSTRYEAAAKLRRLEAANAELLEALKGTTQELMDVLYDINNDRVPFDGDEFHEHLEAGMAAIKRHGGAA